MGKLHKNLTLDEIHASVARVYTDITARDADSAFNTAAENVDKVVRIDSPVSYYILTAITPTWSEFTSTAGDEWTELSDTPGSISAGLVVQGNAGGTALEFGQALDVTDSPTFANITLPGNVDGRDVSVDGSNVDLNTTHRSSDGKNHADVVLNNTHRISDGKNHSDVVLNNAHRVSDGKDHSDVVLNNAHRVSDGSDHSFIDQSLVIGASPTFVDLVLTGDLTVQGLTTTLDVQTLLIEDKNIELGNVVTPTDVTADGGGITLKGTTDKTINWINVTDAWTFNQNVHVRVGSSGVTASSTANALVVEDSKNNGISILTPDANVGRIIFGSPSDPFGAFLGWSFSGNDFAIGSSKIGANFRLTSDLETTNLTLSGASGSELATFAKDVAINGKIKITGGIPAIDRVLTSIDLDGNAEWQVLPQSVGWVGGGGIVNLNVSTDKVAIGGFAPDSKLHVTDGADGAAGAVTAFAGTIATFESLGNGFLSILTPDASVRGILFGEPSSNLAGGIFYNDPGSPDGFQFRTNGNQTKMVIESDGAVGIGTTNPDVTSILDLSSTTKGLLPPRMTSVEKDAIASPATGLSIFDLTIDKPVVRTSTEFKTLLTEDLGNVIAQETFASTNVRFFGELALPAAQGWTDTATGIAIIDLQTQLVFGESKQVVRHNDNTTGGSTTSKITLTAQNWTDINAFGASYSGTSRLDTTNGASGFFAGLQANAAENPLATGNRRYGFLFANDAGDLKVTDVVTGGATITFDGTGGNPLIAFDEWFVWECVVPAGLGSAQFYINKILTTFAPTFGANTGGLGTQIIVSSGSTAGTNRVTYHDNFGVTIFEESSTKTLLAATMAGDMAQINIPEGKRDYTIILPDGNPRAIGAVLRLVATNVLGLISLENQNPAAPEILYNGLRTLVINVAVKQTIEGINTVSLGNVYLGFQAGDIDRTKSIFAQIHSDIDQLPSTTNPEVITFNQQDAINGIGHSTTLNSGELEILPGFDGTYFIMPQPQIGKDSGGVKVDFEMFVQVDRGSGFIDQANSGVKETIKDSDITDVIVSGLTLELDEGDKIRMMQKTSDASVGMGLKNTDPVVGPPTVPRTPSICFTMYRIGGK